MPFDFKILESVNNPSSVHGIYPYRGKISSVEASNIVRQFPKSSKLLDPFCGTGTIVYEGLKHSLVSFGVELNPIAHSIAKGKINIPPDMSVLLDDVRKIILKAEKAAKGKSMPNNALRHFHEKSANEIMRTAMFLDNMNEYVRACFYGAICLTARGCNSYKWTSTSVGKDIIPKVYINFYDKFFQKVKKHYYPVKNIGGDILLHDSRKLTDIFKKNTFDIVFTSPPYFDCLDYTSYYSKIIYDIFSTNRLEIKERLIQKYKDYETDMKLVLEQLYTVCKFGAKIIFVVGDKKIHNKVINGAEFFNNISPFKILNIHERTYSNTSSKVFDSINKTKRKEQIIIWEK